MGSLQKHKTRWRGFVYVAGKSYSRVFNHPHSREGEQAALLELAEFEVEKRKEVGAARRRSSPTDMTLLDLMNRWHANGVRNEWASIRSNEKYADQIRLRIAPYPIADLKVGDVTGDDLADLYADLADHGGVNGGPLAGSTVRITHDSIRSAYNVGNQRRWIRYENPTQFVKPPGTTPVRDLLPLPVNLAHALLEANRHTPKWYAWVAVSLTTGARQSNLLGVRWDHIEEDMITFEQGVVYSGGQRQIKKPKGKERSRQKGWRTKLSDMAMEALAEHRIEVLAECAKLGVDLPDNAYIWHASPHSADYLLNPASSSGVQSWWRRIRRTHPEFEGYTPYGMRRFTVTQLLAAGVDVKTAAARAGHSDHRTTQRFYAYADPEADKHAAQALDDVLSQ